MLNHVGAYSIRANVIRFVRKRCQNREIEIYYEFLDYTKYSLLDMWFTNRSVYKAYCGLKTDASKVPELAKQTTARDGFPQVYKDFLEQYHAFGFSGLKLYHGRCL